MTPQADMMESATSAQPRDAAQDKPANTVNAVASAMRILQDLSTRETPVGVTQLARELKLNTSTCFNILQTLARGELVHFDEASKGYSIGLGVADLARGILAREVDVGLLRPAMERVAQKHEITAALLRRINAEQLMIVQTAASDAPMRIHISLAQRVPLLLGASGQVMAAFAGLSEPELRARFNALPLDRPQNFEEFMRAVEQTRARRWAMDDGYYVRGTVSICVPAFDRDSRPAFALAGTMFSGQYSSSKGAEIAADLAQVAATLEAWLRR